MISRYIKGIGSGTFDWKTVTFNYIAQNPNTSFIQLQIWYGHETNQPLPNIIWIDDVKVYNITKYAKPVTLELPFRIDEENNYKLFIRFFKNQKGGRIKVYLDDKQITIDTKDQLNKFVWKDLGVFHLDAVEHKIVLENVYGFNAVNLFTLIPENEYYKIIGELERILQDKTIIYVFEGETDMYWEDAQIKRYINASNGEELSINERGYVWQKFEVLKNGYYMIGAKVDGTAKIILDGRAFNVSSDNLSFQYIGPLYLDKGTHLIRIEPILGVKTSLDLDVVWIYSVHSAYSKLSLRDLFRVEEEPARVISYERIDPTLWKAKIKAKKPFMLVFAEAFDPLWEARVYKDGVLVEKVKSTQVYGVINGFWINETGNLTIVIRYIPQDWFELGLKISITTFALCVFYLIWDWRRERGDGWALHLERILKRSLRGMWGIRKLIQK